MQRYKCKGCKYHYTVFLKSTSKSSDVRKLALELHLEGLGFRQMGRILKINYVTVYYWIKKCGFISLPRTGTAVEVVELDELHTYVGSKRNDIGYGLLLIDMGSGISLLSV